MLFILTKLNKRKLQTSKCKLQPKATYISSWEIIWFRDSSWVEAPSRLQRGQGSGGWLSAVRAAKTPLPSLPPPILGVCPPLFTPHATSATPTPRASHTSCLPLFPAEVPALGGGLQHPPAPGGSLLWPAQLTGSSCGIWAGPWVGVELSWPPPSGSAHRMAGSSRRC